MEICNGKLRIQLLQLTHTSTVAVLIIKTLLSLFNYNENLLLRKKLQSCHQLVKQKNFARNIIVVVSQIIKII